MSEVKKKNKKRSQWLDVWMRLKKNKSAMFGLFIIGMLFFCAIFVDVIAPYGIDDQNLANSLVKPNSEFWFGTDNFGRDIYSRIIHGSRISLRVGFVAVSISMILGGALGAIAGFFG